MNAADGTPIAEDLRQRYEHLIAVRNNWPTFRYSPATYNFEAGLIERLSRAEQRERVLRFNTLLQAIKAQCPGCVGPYKDHGIGDFFSYCEALGIWGLFSKEEKKVAIAALATPAPEQPAQPGASQPTTTIRLRLLAEDPRANQALLDISLTAPEGVVYGPGEKVLGLEAVAELVNYTLWMQAKEQVSK